MINSNRLISMLLIVFFIMIFYFPVFGLDDQVKQGTVENPYTVPETGSPMKIDGVLNEAAWANAVVLELNYEVRPRDNVQPPVRTEVLLTYDRSHFYIGFRCYDPDPTQIRAKVTTLARYGSLDPSEEGTFVVWDVVQVDNAWRIDGIHEIR